MKTIKNRLVNFINNDVSTTLRVIKNNIQNLKGYFPMRFSKGFSNQILEVNTTFGSAKSKFYYIYIKALVRNAQNDLRIHSENFIISLEVCLINNNNYSLLTINCFFR